MRFKLINPIHYYKAFKNLTKFAISPSYHSEDGLSVAQKIEGTWTMFVVKMILNIIVGVLIGLIYDPDNKTTTSMMERFTPLVLFFVGVLTLPLLEEVAFRLSLKFKPIYLALSLGVISYYITSKAIYQTKLSDTSEHFDTRVIIFLIIIMITYSLCSIPKIKDGLQLFWEDNFKWILYFICVTFAWVHILNYEITLEHLLLMPIITLPKLVSAFCYGYVRINYGFLFSFGIHLCTNGIGLMVKMMG